MLNLRQMLRMSRWARKPPSASRVKLVFAVVAIALILFGIERFIGWPDWLTLDNAPRGRLGR
jgi:hypothetical protein